MAKEKKRKVKKGGFTEIAFRFSRSKTAMIGFVLLVLIVLVAVFADLIVPYDKVLEQNSSNLMATPSKDHWFGTDPLGRDLFARVVHGSRVSIAVGLLTTIVAMVVGGLFGIIAAYYGGRVDMWIMRIVDIFTCIPGILLSITIVATLGPNFINLVLAMVVTSIPGTIRFIRGVVMGVTENDYVEAAKSYGANDMRIMLKYIMPNAMGTIIVDTTMTVAGCILSASGLSYLGLGIQPPSPEWGAMLSDTKQYLRTSPHLLIFPGLAIILTAFSINLVGDGLRDALDPKLRD
ncbi:MAG: ABC transporter permease [Clostridia bacterium]|nr:ABC transporter permease [Clostridia bacterium]